jgi:predicted phage tail protein
MIMNQNIISAVFDSRPEAEAAIAELQSQGIDNGRLSIIGRDEHGATHTDGSGEEAKEGIGDTLKGALGGAGIGAVLGVAALAIPGVGPLAAAGAIAGSAIPGAAAIGAGAGAVAGGVTGMLKDHGVSDEDAGYYEGRINEGGTFVSVDASDGDISAETVREVFLRNGGHNSAQPRMATAQ